VREKKQSFAGTDMGSHRKTGNYSTEWFWTTFSCHFPVKKVILAVLEDLDLSFYLHDVQNFLQLFDFERLRIIFTSVSLRNCDSCLWI